MNYTLLMCMISTGFKSQIVNVAKQGRTLFEDDNIASEMSKENKKVEILKKLNKYTNQLWFLLKCKEGSIFWQKLLFFNKEPDILNG